MNHYVSLTQAQNWYFVFTDERDKRIYTRIAIWAVRLDGSVTGLMSVQGGGFAEPPTSVDGRYVHFDDIEEGYKNSGNLKRER